MPRVDTTLFYESALRKFGVSAQGVQWHNREKQEIRFRILASLIKWDQDKLTVVDAGCGFGDFYHFLSLREKRSVRYLGIDCVEKMVTIAKERTGCEILHKDIVTDPLPQGDYYISSGGLNILTPSETEIFLIRCFEASRKGVIVNFLEGEDHSSIYNIISQSRMEAIAKTLGVVPHFERGYLENDCTVAFYRDKKAHSPT